MRTERLNLVDVGGLGGIQEAWRPFLDRVRPVVFEPNPPVAEALREAVEASDGIVVQKALGSARRDHLLHVTSSLGCTSILTPNNSFLSSYSVAPAFRTCDDVVIDSVRYDELYFQGAVPAPHAIKIDVQGFELEVLRGFGALLDTVLAIQVEAHFYPIYQEQPLIGDIIAYLSKRFRLRKIEPVDHFDGDVVEVDAWFTCLPEIEEKLSAVNLEYLRLIEQVWQLSPRRRVFSPSQFT